MATADYLYSFLFMSGTIKLTSTAIYSGSDGLIQQIMLKLENLEVRYLGLIFRI